jgi:hypothetical protein
MLAQESSVPKTRFDAQILIPYLRWGRVAATLYEDRLDFGPPAPVVRAHKPPSFLQLQAQRRNVLRSTGPRTRAGKRRAALNSSKWQAGSKIKQMVMALGGRSPFEYRRLLRQLTCWFAPADPYSQRLVAGLAEAWWNKSFPPRPRNARLGRRVPGQPANQSPGEAHSERLQCHELEVEYYFSALIDLLASRSRKWKYQLGTRVRRPLGHCQTDRELLRELEKQLTVAPLLASRSRATRMMKSLMNTGSNRY